MYDDSQSKLPFPLKESQNVRWLLSIIWLGISYDMELKVKLRCDTSGEVKINMHMLVKAV